MTIRSAHALATRVVAIVGVFSLSLTEEITLPWLAIGFAGIVFGSFFSQGTFPFRGTFPAQRSRLPSKVVWNGFYILLLCFFAFDFFMVSRSLIVSGSHFILLLMVTKFFNLSLEEDYIHIYLISLLQLLVTSSLTTEIAFGGVFVLFLIAAVWALLTHYLVFEGTSAAVGEPVGQSQTGSSEHITTSFFINTTALSCFALGTTLILFFALPRVGTGFFSRKELKGIRVSGFSDKVDLGEIGPILKDPTVVMRVQMQNPWPESIYWRGKAFDEYDGRAWKNRYGIWESPQRNRQGEFILEPITGGAPPPLNGPMLLQKIMLEPIDTTTIFAASQPARISGLSVVQDRISQSLRRQISLQKRLIYTATSQTTPFFIEDIKRVESLPAPPAIKAAYLQLPVNSDRIVTLAHSLTQSIRRPYEKIRTIEQYLKENYRYSLEVEASAKEAPIDDFLFTQKKGYCEQYATAMVLLLRAVGIPARLVTGFLAGEWNPYGQYYIVRNSDAHAWVEAWFPKSGWVRFDPTPTSFSKTKSPVMILLAQAFDILRWQWNRYIISYDLSDQMRVMTEVKERGHRFQENLYSSWSAFTKRFSGMIENNTLRLGILVFGGMILLAMGLFLIRYPRLHRWRQRRTLSKSAVLFYQQMLHLLASHHFVKPVGQTGMEFCTGLSKGEVASAALTLTTLYYKVRFGSIPLTQEESNQVDVLLNRLRKSMEGRPL